MEAPSTATCLHAAFTDSLPSVPTVAAMSALGQFARFFLVGSAGTALYTLTYLLLRRRVVDSLALIIAWVGATLITNLAHRLITFGAVERRGRLADAGVFFATSLLGLGLTTILLTWTERQGALVHSVMIVGATAIAGVARFLLMRAWINRAVR